MKAKSKTRSNSSDKNMILTDSISNRWTIRAAYDKKTNCRNEKEMNDKPTTKKSSAYPASYEKYCAVSNNSRQEPQHQLHMSSRRLKRNQGTSKPLTSADVWFRCDSDLDTELQSHSHAIGSILCSQILRIDDNHNDDDYYHGEDDDDGDSDGINNGNVISCRLESQEAYCCTHSCYQTRKANNSLPSVATNNSNTTNQQLRATSNRRIQCKAHLWQRWHQITVTHNLLAILMSCYIKIRKYTRPKQLKANLLLLLITFVHVAAKAEAATQLEPQATVNRGNNTPSSRSAPSWPPATTSSLQNKPIAEMPSPLLSAALQSPSHTAADPHVIKLLNRENILKQRHHKTRPSQPTQAEPQANHNQLNLAKDNTNAKNSNEESTASFSSCQSCHLREKAKHDSLESIKMHILSQLRLTQLPNIEIPHEVPQNIIADFYKKFNHNGQQRHPRLQPQQSKSSQKQVTDILKIAGTESLSTDDNTHHIEGVEVMQGDDPTSSANFHHHHRLTDNGYQEDFSDEQFDDIAEESEEDFEDPFSPRVNSVYVFPIMSSRLRHNRKTELLHFKFENTNQATITRTIMHMYVRGRDWMAEYQPEILGRIQSSKSSYHANSTNFEIQDMGVYIHRALKRSNSSNYTHTVQIGELHEKIPPGLGKWVQIELKELSNLWMDEDEASQGIVIKTTEAWMRHFVVTGVKRGTEGEETENKFKQNQNALTAHIEVRTERRRGRFPRSTSLDCQESDNEVRCCRYPLKVNFTSFGWSFVVAPTDFDAYFCNGECKLGYLEQYTHTHVVSLSRSASPCCSPTKMSSLSLLYFNLNQNLVLSTIPNMTVEKCSCS